MEFIKKYYLILIIIIITLVVICGYGVIKHNNAPQPEPIPVQIQEEVVTPVKTKPNVEPKKEPELLDENDMPKSDINVPEIG